MSRLVLVDTHSHIHGADYPLAAVDVLANASVKGVGKIITLGSNPANSQAAINYVLSHDGYREVMVRACVGYYPHEIKVDYRTGIEQLQQQIDDYRAQICGVGEVGLDYCYDTVARVTQLSALEELMQLAVDNDLPVSFHVRSGQYGDAFIDFLALLNNFNGRVRGVVHSFTDSLANLDKVLSAGLYISVNGIATFNKDEQLRQVYQQVPLDHLLLETDSPYLAPVPYRGKVNQPCHIRSIAEFMAKLRGIELAELATQTTTNAQRIYGL
ncbi:MAG: TatD family hydrolase [Candidatus Saccharibacteria bacterium]|nr:TatD family hydrolase [Candidatus Saccharibacteria bacterium]